MASPLRLRLTRTLTLPDPLRLARYLRAPELGPRVLFFSGGSALNPLCRELIKYTHNSIHVITTFDSGGSSAVLRKAFKMPAVGDIRNRLMALADPSAQGNPEVVRLFAHRLPVELEAGRLEAMLGEMVAGKHPLVAAVGDPMRKIIRNHLRHLREALPPGFDLRGASVGNLVLTGGYLNSERHLDPVIFLFSKLAEARGVVRPVRNAHLHLAAELADGRVVVGQHLLTGREQPRPSSPIKRLFLSSAARAARPARIAIHEKLRRLIAQAELICFPMGSFYTSLVANLLPEGVCQAVADNDCPKVFIPNPAGDPETRGLDLAGMVETLIAYLRQGCAAAPPVESLLNLVLLDRGLAYPGGQVDKRTLTRLGPRVLEAALSRPEAPDRYDPSLLAELLLSLT